MNETPLPTVLLRTVLWRRLDEPSFEYARLHEFADGYILDGRVLTLLDRQPAEVHYIVLCGRDWATRNAHVSIYQGTASRHVDVRRDERNQWFRNETRVPELDGLMDVDLAITPSTNTLALRRLNLDVGATATAGAAWIRFPELTVEHLPQRYTRVDDMRYRYESGNGSFNADIEVDEESVVVRYDDLWERVTP